MYSFGQLARLTSEGFRDLLPALRQAFNSDATDDQLDLVYGTNPRIRIFALATGGILVGATVARIGPEFPLMAFVNWSAVAVGLTFAVIIRRYLFSSNEATADDFPWLAGSLVPPIALCSGFGLVTAAAGWNEQSGGLFFLEATVELGSALVLFTNSLGIAAALTIAVATLCYSRDWIKALFDLALRMFLFRIMVWVTAFVMFEVQIIGEIAMPILSRMLSINIPEWVSILADQAAYAGLLTLAYLAIIGGTWTVCKASFSELLSTGQVDILQSIQDLADGPKKTKAREKKALAKKAKKAKKAAKAKQEKS